jgi:hypothetical protein
MRDIAVVLFAAMTLTAISAPAAHAQNTVFSPSAFSAVLDARLVAADGERSWTDGGFGKARYGDESGARFAEAGIAWRPRFTDTVSALVSVEAQGNADPTLDVSEAFVAFKSTPGGAVRLSGRAGLYWPQMSLEHDGPFWTVADTITPSAINSWAGEELKVGGAEITARASLHGQSFAATVGGIGFGDTAGTLLSFRGWALHDLKNTASSLMPLPPLSPYMALRQRPDTRSLAEIDGRTGLYGRLEWSPSPNLTLDLFGYDNRGDRTSVTGAMDWSWDTRFTEAGLSWAVDDKTRIRAQALGGVTLMGYPDQATGQIWLDVKYASAYVSATRAIGPGAVTARLDRFETDDHTLTVADNNDEDGWAQLVAYRWDVRPRANIVFEWLRIDSDRPSRALAGEAPHQTQTVVQTALRLDL